MNYPESRKVLGKAKSEILEHKFTYLFLFLILVAAFFVRVYRIDQLLQFYFDQGRDALAVWDLIYNHKISLIGPTTGIAGIFRGPFYYWLITPAYFLGGGNPIWPSVFLSILGILAIILIYYLGLKIQNRATGLIASIIAGFSYYLVLGGRWLSNPTPMLLLSLLLVWMMILVTQGKKWAWIFIAFLAGVSLFHFGSSGEFFYFPAILIFTVWQRKNIPNIKILLLSIFAFSITAAPLIIFDLRHEQILSNNIYQFIFNKNSFKANFQDVLSARVVLYDNVFLRKVFLTINAHELALLLISAVSFTLFLPRFIKNKGIIILILLLSTVVVGMLFFQGNDGNIFDYYFTGYYLIFVLLLSAVLGQLWLYFPGKVFVAIFIYVCLTQNLPIVRNYITSEVEGAQLVIFGSQKQALEWIYQDAKGANFNVDSYVPPVIPYAYEYLLKWKNYPGYTTDQQTSLLYTLYEDDPPHPERLEAWLNRQQGIGKVEYGQRFGRITVERRLRLK